MSSDAHHTAARSGEIHDIGFRHYDGTRLGAPSMFRALYVESLRGAYGLGRSGKSKVVPILILVAMCVPALIIAMIAALTPIKSMPVDYSSYLPNVQVLIAIFLAAQAPALMSRDLRHRVTSLYFSRPITRTLYVQAKFAAMTTAVFILLVAPLILLFVGALLAKFPVEDQLTDFARSIVGAALFAILLSGVTLLLAALTTRRGLGVAAIIVTLLMLGGVQATIREIAYEVGNDTLATYAPLLSPFSLVDSVAGLVLRADSSIPVDTENLTAAFIFGLAWIVVVAASYGALLWRYRGVSVS